MKRNLKIALLVLTIGLVSLPASGKSLNPFQGQEFDMQTCNVFMYMIQQAAGFHRIGMSDDDIVGVLKDEIRIYNNNPNNPVQLPQVAEKLNTFTKNLMRLGSVNPRYDFMSANCYVQ